MRQLLRYFFLILSTIPLKADSQVMDPAIKWSIQDCFRYATEHNIQISTLRLNEQSSYQDVLAAKGSKIPGLSASVINTFNNANNSLNSNSGLVNQLTKSTSYSVNSSILLWNDNYINNNIRQKELLIRSAALSVQQSVNNITLSITQAYLDILLAKENEKYIAELVATSKARVKQGQMFFDAGSIAKKDLLQLQAQLATDTYLLVQTQNAIQQNILTLKQILQLPGDTSFDITSPADVFVAPSLIPLHEVQQNALHDFPEIKIGRLGIDIAMADIAKAKAGFKPALTANGSLGTGYSNVLTNSIFPKTSYLKQTDNNFYQRVGLTLSIPIFSNRINTTNVAKANIAYKQAHLNFQNDQLVLSQAVEQAYLNARNAMQLYDAAEMQLKATTETYRIANEQFKLGALNTYDLLLQRNQYVQALQAYTQAKYSAVLQQKIYEFYMGNPVTF
jgi:Outer membrane protein